MLGDVYEEGGSVGISEKDTGGQIKWKYKTQIVMRKDQKEEEKDYYKFIICLIDKINIIMHFKVLRNHFGYFIYNNNINIY